MSAMKSLTSPETDGVGNLHSYTADVGSTWLYWTSVRDPNQDGKYLRLGFCMVHPWSRLNLLWNVMSLSGILVCLLLTPFELAFELDAGHNGTFAEAVWATVLPCLDVFFCLDVLLNFRLAFFLDDELVQDTKVIALHYLSGWFIIDLVASMSPWIELAARVTAIGLLRNLRLMRLLRLLKLVRVFSHSSHIDISVECKCAVNYLKISFATIAWTHLLACGWHAIGASSEGDSWLSAYHGGDSWRAMSTAQNYLVSMYWAFVTVTTVGYGDITPTNDAERLFAIVATFAGTAVFAYIVGEIQAMATKKSVASEECEQRMESVEEFMRARKLSRHLRLKIRAHYRNISAHHVLYNESTILEDLPFGLRKEVKMLLRQEVIMKVPFMKNAPPDLLSELVVRLHWRVVGAGELVIQCGEEGSELFIIDKGEVEVDIAEGLPPVKLSDGMFFGETALLNECVRSASVIATCVTELLILSKADLDAVLVRFEEYAGELKLLLTRRYAEATNASPASQATDDGFAFESILAGIGAAVAPRHTRGTTRVTQTATRVTQKALTAGRPRPTGSGRSVVPFSGSTRSAIPSVRISEAETEPTVCHPAVPTRAEEQPRPRESKVEMKFTFAEVDHDDCGDEKDDLHESDSNCVAGRSSGSPANEDHKSLGLGNRLVVGSGSQPTCGRSRLLKKNQTPSIELPGVCTKEWQSTLERKVSLLESQVSAARTEQQELIHLNEKQLALMEQMCSSFGG